MSKAEGAVICFWVLRGVMVLLCSFSVFVLQ